MSLDVLDRLASRWLVVTAGVLGLVSFLLGTTGVYFQSLGASNWQLPFFLGFWGMELALFFCAVAAVQALWFAWSTAQPGFYALLAITGLVGVLSAMVAACAAFLWIMSSPSSLVFGKMAAIGLGGTFLLTTGAFIRRTFA